MTMKRPSPSRRPSILAISLLGIGVSAAIGMLIGLSSFDSSSVADSPASAEVEAQSAESPAAPNAEASLPAVSLARAPAPNFEVGTKADVEVGTKADVEVGTKADVEAGTQASVEIGTEPGVEVKAESNAAIAGDAAAQAGAKVQREASIEISGSDFPRIVEGVLERGDTLARSMTGQGVNARTVDQIARGMIGYYDFRHSQPGHSYRLVQNEDGEIESFRYRISQIIGYELRRDTSGGYAVVREEAELWPRQTMVAGIVTYSLYGAITDLGAGPQLASDFTDVFAYDVDFSRMIRAGDEFRILYEQLYRTDQNGEDVFVRPGRILAARYAGTSGEHTAVYYESSEGRGGYYRPDGSTVQREFLMAPVRYARVTSRYSAARRHPILKITRPHHGIDYAAATGTPVFAVAGGEVIYNSRAGGFGNLVKVRHEGGYVTYYGHLSRFADGLHVGQPVSQKQVIGYVGSTGLSTGPHVCFRVAKNGTYVNPIQLPTPESPPLPEQFTQSFQIHRDNLLASLDSGTLVAADEAL
ncbi:MAG: M23 family metallopeptidase [Deltaproteobacteria bacterium]|nr:M23 family metallopeptidase [Deltaproteobacteria bacterium]